MRPNGTPEQLEKRRIHAIQLIKQGKSQYAVARILGASKSSVSRWLETYKHKGKQGLTPHPASGRPPRLSQRQKKKLSNDLLKGPLTQGHATDLWTLGRIAKLIHQQTGIQYHQGHVWKILKGMGWSCQKPERRALQRNEKQIEHWKRHRWPHIKKRSTTWCPSGIPG